MIRSNTGTGWCRARRAWPRYPVTGGGTSWILNFRVTFLDLVVPVAASFVLRILLEMSDRSQHCASSAVFLPMSRYDIADYLAMAVETVSRTLTELRIRQTIVFRGVRHFRICNRDALKALTCGLTDQL
jgi:hypothetical protein